MTLPDQPGGSSIASDLQFGVSGNDGSISGRNQLTQAFVTPILKAQLLSSPAYNGANTSVFGTLVGLPGMLAKFIENLLGISTSGTSTLGGLLALVEQVPLLGNFVSLLDNLWNGATGNTTGSGKSLTDVLTAFQTLFGNVTGIGTNASNALSSITTLQSALTTFAPNALTALEQAVANTITLGQRANKSASQGANPTSQTSFTIGHFSSGGSMVTSTLAAGNAIAQRFTVPEVAANGFMEILASGTSVTNIFTNIYSINPTTNVKTALFNSSNIATLIPTSLNHVRVLLPGMPAVNPGDELLLEVVNGGSNALTLATKATGAPNNTNEVIQNVGFSRATSAGGNSPTSLTSGQGSYAGTVPYAVIGIAAVPADYHPPEADSWTVAGTYSSIPWPTWLTAGDTIDNVGIGAGGGGGSSLAWLSGQGGGAAVWGASTLVMGTDIKLGSSFTVVVGARGGTSTGNSGSTPGVNGNGNFGGNTTLTYTDPSNTAHTITFTGGQWGGWGANHNGANSNTASSGQAASNITFDGTTYYGGAAVGTGSTGQSPGGGGGGAIPYLEGSPGGVGALNLYMSQTI